MDVLNISINVPNDPNWAHSTSLPSFLPKCPPRGLSAALRVRIFRFLLLGWRSHAIAAECHVGLSTIYKYSWNLLQYGSVRLPTLRKLKRSRKLITADKEALLKMLLVKEWRRLDEMAFWLWCEHDAFVFNSIIFRLLKRKKWTQKELRRIALDRSEDLRKRYLVKMGQYAAEDLVFLNELIFNKKTGWRHRVYDLIKSSIRYPADIQRDRTWSILAGMIIADYVSCTGVKEDYFKTSDVLNWLRTAFLSALRRKSDRSRVIVLNNNFIYIDQVIVETIEIADYTIQFLSPYSPDYNPIEFSFSVLKAWLQRNYV